MDQQISVVTNDGRVRPRAPGRQGRLLERNAQWGACGEARSSMSLLGYLKGFALSRVPSFDRSVTWGRSGWTRSCAFLCLS